MPFLGVIVAKAEPEMTSESSSGEVIGNEVGAKSHTRCRPMREKMRLLAQAPLQAQVICSSACCILTLSNSVCLPLAESLDKIQGKTGYDKLSNMQADITAGVSTVVQGVLGLLPHHDQPLMEAGLDSLGAVELRNGLANQFGLANLPASLTFDYPSIAALASFISTLLPSHRGSDVLEVSASVSESEACPSLLHCLSLGSVIRITKANLAAQKR